MLCVTPILHQLSTRCKRPRGNRPRGGNPRGMGRNCLARAPNGSACSKKETRQPTTKSDVSIPCRDKKRTILVDTMLSHRPLRRVALPPPPLYPPASKLGAVVSWSCYFTKNGSFFIPLGDTQNSANNFEVGGKGGQPRLANAFRMNGMSQSD